MSTPSHWTTSTMGQIGKYLNGRAFKEEDWKSSGRPIIRIQNLTGSGKSFNYFQGEVEPRYLVKEGDLLFSWAATLGTYIWHGPEAVLNQHIFKVESNINPRFHRYLLEHSIQEMQSKTHGSGMVHITKSEFDKIEVLIPPPDEQRRIVETLDDHLSRLDKALTESHYAASATLRFSASLLHSMFTGDLMQRELGVEELNLTALAGVAEVQSGGTPKGLDRLSSETATGDHTVPFYKVGDMNLDARYMKASRSYLTQEDVDALRLKVIPSGSVVFPKAGGAIATDKKRLVQVPGPIDLNCMAVIPGKAILPTYLAWWFESFKLSDLSNGSILPQIGKTAVMQVQLPIPSLSDQEKVVQYLEENISMVRSQARSIDGVAASISTLRRSVLNDAFSGKLVDRY